MKSYLDYNAVIWVRIPLPYSLTSSPRGSGERGDKAGACGRLANLGDLRDLADLADLPTWPRPLFQCGCLDQSS